MCRPKGANGLEARAGSRTGPAAVGVHAVSKSRITGGESAVVLGCGPVGLAVIADLARKGISPIVAADFSPMRRQLAQTLGHLWADAVGHHLESHVFVVTGLRLGCRGEDRLG